MLTRSVNNVGGCRWRSFCVIFYLLWRRGVPAHSPLWSVLNFLHISCSLNKIQNLCRHVDVIRQLNLYVQAGLPCVLYSTIRNIQYRRLKTSKRFCCFLLFLGLFGFFFSTRVFSLITQAFLQVKYFFNDAFVCIVSSSGWAYGTNHQDCGRRRWAGRQPVLPSAPSLPILSPWNLCNIRSSFQDSVPQHPAEADWAGCSPSARAHATSAGGMCPGKKPQTHKPSGRETCPPPTLYHFILVQFRKGTQTRLLVI